MIDFYTNPKSRGVITRWMLEEIGAPYTTHLLDYQSTMKSPEYLAINPMGKVPAIVHDGQVVTEAAAICAHLADAFPEAGLAPAPEQRGAYYRWLFFGAGPFEAAISNAGFGFVVPEGRERAIGYGRLEDVLDTLEGHLSERRYILGEKFTAADVYLGSQIGFGAEFGLFPMRAGLSAYWERIKDRPARVRGMQLDKEADDEN
ncbi:glutathione S-transferase family protein [Pararhodobacter oceanensis]|uniref:Glutathione S-transferase n=1 Tax=Pararhodobacter oceanensis TaxID=2172121 RepID=A0A2T8HV10_9RHOB|nr:glutathione S-transferase family protein [Pararhodobacter oceanensis]PVH29254.1 glutathione S-transferase [Pararhodobacter oceanensis]